MKRLWLTLISVVFVMNFATMPAQASSNTIQVYVDNNPIRFTHGSPLTRSNTTLVPFRTIFEKLGLSVTWDGKSQTVTGKKNGLVIQLKIGTNRATVNGNVKKLTVAPTTIQGTTYIPLRFVGEASRAKVRWDPENQAVQIQTLDYESKAKLEIEQFFKKLIAYENAEDAKLLVDQFEVPNKQILLESFTNMYKKVDIQKEIVSMDDFNLDFNVAEITLEEQSRYKSGKYIPDNIITNQYRLIHTTMGWKISGVLPMDININVPEEVLKNTADVPLADKTAIEDTLTRFYEAIHSKDVTTLLSLLTEEQASTNTDSFEEFFNSNQHPSVTSSTNPIIYRYDGTTAIMYTESLNKVISDSSKDTYSAKNKNIYVFEKSTDGKWLISQVYLISSDPVN